MAGAAAATVIAVATAIAAGTDTAADTAMDLWADVHPIAALDAVMPAEPEPMAEPAAVMLEAQEASPAEHAVDSAVADSMVAAVASTVEAVAMVVAVTGKSLKV